MKTLKVYVITYKRCDVLNKALAGIFDSSFKDIKNTEVNIINNHSEFKLDDRFVGKVRVLHNMTRPDWSMGNLSESYNQCLLDGFRNLNNPDSEIVCHMQNDIVLHPQWAASLVKLHEKFSFVVGEKGDNIVSYTPDSVKRIGMWDERICSVHHKETDYFLRALICNKENTFMNDRHHNRLLNNINPLPLDSGFRHDGEWVEINQHDRKNDSYSYIKRYFESKWGTNILMRDWPDTFKNNPPSLPNISNYMKYYYFEKDIDKTLYSVV